MRQNRVILQEVIFAGCFSMANLNVFQMCFNQCLTNENNLFKTKTEDKSLQHTLLISHICQQWQSALQLAAH